MKGKQVVYEDGASVDPRMCPVALEFQPVPQVLLPRPAVVESAFDQMLFEVHLQLIF